MNQNGVINHIPLLDQLIVTAPILQQLILDDCAIAICDHNQLRAYFPGRKINQNVKVGDPLLPSSGVGRAISSGMKVVTRVGAELFGIPYVVVAVPVIENGKGIVGGISLSMSVEREDRLFKIARDLQLYIEGVTTVVKELSEKSTQLEQLETEWKEIVNQTYSITKQSGELTHAIKQIAKETGILALNSGIEAARHGENGRVFSTVAVRMRNLSSNVNQSVEQIGVNLNSIGGSSRQLQEQLSHLEVISTHIERVSKELDNQINEVKKIIERLIELEEKS